MFASFSSEHEHFTHGMYITAFITWNSIAGLFTVFANSFTKKSKQARVPTFVWLLCDDATNAKGPGCDEGTNLR